MRRLLLFTVILFVLVVPVLFHSQSRLPLMGVGGSGCTAVTAPVGAYFSSANMSDFTYHQNVTLTGNVTVSPACTTTAATMIENTTAGVQHLIAFTRTTTITTAPVTFTLYIRNVSGGRFLDLAVYSSTYGAYAYLPGINPVTCTTSQTASVAGGWSAVSSGLVMGQNNWCKATLNFTPTADTAINPTIIFDSASDGSGQSYTGDGSSGVSLWGSAL